MFTVYINFLLAHLTKQQSRVLHPLQLPFGTSVSLDYQRVIAKWLKCNNILLITCFLLKSSLFLKKP